MAWFNSASRNPDTLNYSNTVDLCGFHLTLLEQLTYVLRREDAF